MMVIPISLLRTRSSTTTGGGASTGGTSTDGVIRDYTLGPEGGILGDSVSTSGGSTAAVWTSSYLNLNFAGPGGSINLILLKDYQGGAPWSTMNNNSNYTIRIHIRSILGSEITIPQISIKGNNLSSVISNQSLEEAAAIGGYVEASGLSGTDPYQFFNINILTGPPGGTLQINKIEIFAS